MDGVIGVGMMSGKGMRGTHKESVGYSHRSSIIRRHALIPRPNSLHLDSRIDLSCPSIPSATSVSSIVVGGINSDRLVVTSSSGAIGISVGVYRSTVVRAVPTVPGVS